MSLLLALQFANLFGSALTSYRLLASRLFKRYPLFFGYLIFRIVAAICGISINVKSPAYAYFWAISTPISWVFKILVVIELTSVTLERYPGIRSLSRWFVYLGTAISVGIALIMLIPQLSPAMTQGSKLLRYLYAGDRAITLSLAVFMLIVMFLLSRYPIQLPRNAAVHAIIYSIFFLTNSLSTLLKVLFGLSVYANIDAGFQAVSAACGLAWFWLLSQKGEEVTVHLPNVDKRREEQLLSQLNYLNQTLVKSGKS